MPWTYSQSTGQLRRNGSLMATGYSGIGIGRNNPSMQALPNVGPIPLGSYAIGAPFHHPHAGNFAMRLTPIQGTHTFGRTGLLMHGDSSDHPGEASNGCIVEDLHARMQVWASGDHVITVVP
jgi:hypothetical protein